VLGYRNGVDAHFTSCR